MQLVRTLRRLGSVRKTLEVSQRAPTEGERASDPYDELNREMVLYALQHTGQLPPIGLYFKVGEGRGTTAAIAKVADLLQGSIYDGLDSEQNPYYPQGK